MKLSVSFGLKYDSSIKTFLFVTKPPSSRLSYSKDFNHNINVFGLGRIDLLLLVVVLLHSKYRDCIVDIKKWMTSHFLVLNSENDRT